MNHTMISNRYKVREMIEIVKKGMEILCNIN
jgi:hypothetical protein